MDTTNVNNYDEKVKSRARLNAERIYSTSEQYCNEVRTEYQVYVPENHTMSLRTSERIVSHQWVKSKFQRKSSREMTHKLYDKRLGEDSKRIVTGIIWREIASLLPQISRYEFQ